MKNLKLSLTVALLLSGQVFAEPMTIEEEQIEVVADGLVLKKPTPSSTGAGDAAKKLANPLASMISLPIQANYQPNMGANDEGSQWLTNVQPVIPIELNDDWNIISRTIIPLISKDTGIPGESTINAVGDIVQSAWLSPKELTDNGWVWGVGAAFLIPSGSELSARKWGIGPTAVALKQDGPWTYGGLTNHIWDFAGSDGVTTQVNQTFVQPFLTYITPQAVTVALNTESTYDWRAEQWTVPVNLMVMKVLKVGTQLVQVGGGVTYWAEAPESGPEGWGARLILTFIFPK